MLLGYTSSEMLLVIAAIGAVIVNIIMAWKTGTRVEQTLMKASIIEGHVNSKETKYVEQLASAQREIDLLKNVIIDKDKVAGLLAQSVSQVVATKQMGVPNAS